MKMAKKHENDELLVITLKHVSVLKVVVNCPRTQNSGQCLMKTAIKRENDEFLVISLKHVTGLIGHANPLGTQKPWEISHENGKKNMKTTSFLS